MQPTQQRLLLGAGSGLLNGFILITLLFLQPQITLLDGGLLGQIGLLLGATLIGMLIGLAAGLHIHTPGSGLVWGMSIGILVWIAGLILLPLGSQLTMQMAQGLFSWLVAAVLTNGSTGVTYYLMKRLLQDEPTIARDLSSMLGVAAGGGVAGLLGGLAFGRWMQQTDFFPLVASLLGGQAASMGQGLHLLISALIGATYGLLFARDIKGLGPYIAWGAAYGLIWWMLGPLTLQPLLLGEGIQWTLAAAQQAFAPLIGHIIYGIILGVTYAFLWQIWHVLFVASDPLYHEPEGAGTRSIRTILLGGLASIVGGLLFTWVMVTIDLLPVVAGLIGLSSEAAGFLVHMVISTIIGVTYGFLFRRETPTYGISMLWGGSYGLVWWFLGPLTLMPTILGEPLQWSLESALGAYPSLIGHILYGIAVALAYHALSQRFDPGVRETRLEYTNYSGTEPALWTILLVLTLTMPLLLASG